MRSRVFISLLSLLLLAVLLPGRAFSRAKNNTKDVGGDPLAANVAVVNGDALTDLNAQLKAKQENLRQLQDKIDAYNKKIEEAHSRAASLSNQISIIEDSAEKTALDIETKELEIDQLELEIAIIQKEIEAEEGRVIDTRGKIGMVLQTINQYDDKGAIEVVFNSGSFSEIIDQIYYSETLNTRLRERLDMVELIRTNLEQNRRLLETKKEYANTVRIELDDTRESLETEKGLKTDLLRDTKENEEQFQDLVRRLKSDQSTIDSDIVTLERTLRERLKAQELQQLQQDQNVATPLSWPVPHSRGISAYFHDPGYPFRYVFEHPAIDIRAYQSTPIAAAASGYVARAKNGGMGYSYIMLVHANGLATVYGHVSQFHVTEGSYVTRGQIIAASGGKPGTPGAGPLTTGPHLHLEVRLNGIPVDPLRYLP